VRGEGGRREGREERRGKEGGEGRGEEAFLWDVRKTEIPFGFGF